LPNVHGKPFSLISFCKKMVCYDKDLHNSEVNIK
jgi:hypothetical protein